MKTTNRKKKRGFTLVELIVVLAIVGVISSIAAPTILSKVEEAKVKADMANASSIALAVKSEIAAGKEIADGDIANLDTAIGSYFDGMVPHPKSEGGNFIVNIQDNKVTVSSATKIYYPCPDGVPRNK